MKNNTIRVGRPYLPLEKKRKVRSIKMSDQEWQEIRNRASEETMSASKYIREKVLGVDSAPIEKDQLTSNLRDIDELKQKAVL